MINFIRRIPWHFIIYNYPINKDYDEALSLLFDYKIISVYQDQSSFYKIAVFNTPEEQTLFLFWNSNKHYAWLNTGTFYRSNNTPTSYQANLDLRLFLTGATRRALTVSPAIFKNNRLIFSKCRPKTKTMFHFNDIIKKYEQKMDILTAENFISRYTVPMQDPMPEPPREPIQQEDKKIDYDAKNKLKFICKK